ncbi:DNA glycosylase AlkZ-like family protein [Alkalicoccobacillus plakortidis]|uniref:Winged helix DNA-binding domain-containing protein n=1 Tax=Alkalicoccobacillus plakortidis TaxID=444060 RepID=A0ABT0XMV4_9BACI|nr:crosslink repair DNA glycosylase YcaQ family protein [Alkalicoccobacillus plakortidis]MCM2677065.1 winged helix DNA-binding domain-containing protein [Alkalicoccobacillus plakortidis]
MDKATTKESSHVLSLLHRTGDIQVVKREGATRYFDLTEKVIPQELLLRASDISPTEASHLLLQKYYRSYRLFSANDARYGWQKFKAADRRSIHQNMINNGHIVPVEIEGVDRTYAVLAEDVELLKNDLSSSPTNYVQFLPPLDNLLWSRDRLVDIFSFYYRWEIYIPKEKRQFGAYGMPILDQDQLIGKMDPLFDRQNGTLIVQNLTVDPGFKQTKSRLKRIEKGLILLAKQIGADKVQWDDK